MAKPSFVRTLSEVTQRKTVRKELLGKTENLSCYGCARARVAGKLEAY